MVDNVSNKNFKYSINYYSAFYRDKSDLIYSIRQWPGKPKTQKMILEASLLYT